MKAVFHVEHRGQFKMVGKLFPLDGDLVFLHEAGPGQHHRDFDGPGVDVVLIKRLLDLGVLIFHHYERESDTLFISSPSRIAAGVRATYDARTRYFLPWSRWSTHPGLYYKPPWITHVEELRDPKRYVETGQLALLDEREAS